MDKDLVQLEQMGAEVARLLGKYATDRSRATEEARQRFLEMPNAPAVRRKLRPGLLVRAGVPAGAVAASVILAFWPSAQAPLTFRIDGRSGALDTWVAAPETRSVLVDFSDGTGLRIEQAARARVVNVTTAGAEVSLESGTIHADVVHTGRSAWRFAAGPINVRVIGTRFDLAWDPGLEQFSVAVTEGSVGVSGSIAGAERPVRAGERLFISVRDHRLELINSHQISRSPAGSSSSQSSSLPPVESALPPAVVTDDQRPPRGTASIPASTAHSARPHVVNSPRVAAPTLWRELAKQGKLREAFAAVESAGFTEACETASPAELLVLGDAARLAGHPDRVSQALLTLRQRYPNDSRRSAAAFGLGKIAFDQRHAYEQASSWFSTCLREQPSGGMAREASGRLIESLRAAGNSKAAQTAARSYLSRYPDGPHADLARSLLQ